MNGKISRNMKLYNLLFFFCFSILFSQNVRVTYDYRYKIDSTDLKTITSEIMILDVSKNQSIFISSAKYEYDSLANAKNFSQKIHNALPFALDKSKVKEYVTKDYLSHKVLLHTQVGSQSYVVPEQKKLEWTVLNDMKNIRGINVQKATSMYLGRKWTAWFSNEFAIQDGPYKFMGLPGLILELYDDNFQHHFSMLGILKSNSNYEHKNQALRETEISDKDFNKLWKDFLKNPSKNYVSQSSNPNIGMSITFDGKTYSESEILREIEKREKEKYKKINNFLDLELYK